MNPKKEPPELGAAEHLLYQKARKEGHLDLTDGIFYRREIQRLINAKLLERRDKGFFPLEGHLPPPAIAPEPTKGVSVRFPLSMIARLDEIAQERSTRDEPVTRTDVVIEILGKALGAASATEAQPPRRHSETRQKAVADPAKATNRPGKKTGT